MGKNISVLHAITRLDKGGSPANILLSAMGLAGMGYKVDLLYGLTEEADEHLIARAKEKGVCFIKEESLIRSIHPVKDILAFLKIFKLIKKKRYDIVHAHAHKAGLICRFAAKCAGVKHIIYTPHGHVFYGYFGKALTGVIILIEKIAAHITDKIVGLTEAECDEWLKFGIGRKEQYVVIPSGIEFDVLERETSSRIDWKSELGIPPGKTLVGSIGRFIEIKGYRYFVEAAIEQAKKRDNICFILAGDGPLREEYEEMIASNGIKEEFHIIPWQKDIGAFLKALDIFVLSSLNEGMGRVLVEAMFFKKPVIATSVGGVPSIIADGTGFLVEPASSKAISAAIDSIIDDSENAKRMAQAAHERAIKGYSAPLMINEQDALYKELFEERSKKGTEE